MFQQKEVSDYYDQTQVHYQLFWDLNRSKSLHYGIWHPETKTFAEALKNTNLLLAQKATIQRRDHVLDVGCGIGGSCLFLSKQIDCTTTGISLSQKQIDQANLHAKNEKLDQKAHFVCANHCHTPFDKDSFDVVWGIESHLSEINKDAFFEEAFRVLKPGGRLIIADYFKNEDKLPDHDQNILNKWLNCWAIKDIVSKKQFISQLEKNGFARIDFQQLNKEIYPSAKRMLWGSIAGFFGTKIYGLYNRKASPFSKIHYKAGWFQFKALKKGLWSYGVVYAEKPE